MPFMRGKICTAYQYGGRKPTFFSSETFSNSAYGQGNLVAHGAANGQTDGSDYLDPYEPATGSASRTSRGSEQPLKVPSPTKPKKSPSPPPVIREEFTLKI